MPWGDGTGPLGQGPMTGRRMGYCAGYGVPGYMNPGFGFGRGFGRGFRFRRFRRVIPVQSEQIQYPQPLTKEEQIKILEEEKKAIQEELKAIEERIKELRK